MGEGLFQNFKRKMKKSRFPAPKGLRERRPNALAQNMCALLAINRNPPGGEMSLGIRRECRSR